MLTLYSHILKCKVAQINQNINDSVKCRSGRVGQVLHFITTMCKENSQKTSYKIYLKYPVIFLSKQKISGGIFQSLLVLLSGF